MPANAPPDSAIAGIHAGYNVSPPVAPPPATEFHPAGIQSQQILGDFNIASPIYMGTGAASAEAFGDLYVIGPGTGFRPSGIPSAEAFGYPSGRPSFNPLGIVSGERFGTWTGKTAPEPEQIVVILNGGPNDGESRIVGEPWPQHTVTVEDPVTGEFRSYFVEVDKPTEPYLSEYSPPTGEDEFAETESGIVLVGPKGERGDTGPQGEQGEPGEQGLTLELNFPETLPSGWVRVGDWLEFHGYTDTGPTPDHVYEAATIDEDSPWGVRQEGRRIVFRGMSRWRYESAGVHDVSAQYLTYGFPFVYPDWELLSTPFAPLVTYQPGDLPGEAVVKGAWAYVGWASVGTPETGFRSGHISMQGGWLGTATGDVACVGWDGVSVGLDDPLIWS